MAPARLRRETSADLVAAYIRRAVVDGDLRPGERLRPEEIADSLGVSRIPVREAIIALDREGWVRFEANRGAHVATFDAEDVRDHFELRGLVLGLIARRAATAATDEDADDLADRLAAVQAAGDLGSFTELNDRLLGHLLRVAGSPRLTAALLVTPSIIPQGFFDLVPGGRRIQEQDLPPVVAAVRARSADQADAAMRTLLHHQGEATVAALAAAGIVDRRAAPGASASPLRTPAATTSADDVARHIRRLIFDGRLRAGERLPQAEVARAVGVSRIPVREAVIALEREGWLRVEPHRGAFVNAVDEQAVTDGLALYGRFFGLAARRAVARTTPAGLPALTEAAAAVTQADSAAAMDQANTRYLGMLVRLAGSNRLTAVVRSIAQVVPGNYFALVPAGIAIQRRGVAALQAAVEHGDGDAAEQAVAELVREHARALAGYLSRPPRRAPGPRPQPPAAGALPARG